MFIILYFCLLTFAKALIRAFSTFLEKAMKEFCNLFEKFQVFEYFIVLLPLISIFYFKLKTPLNSLICQFMMGLK